MSQPQRNVLIFQWDPSESLGGDQYLTLSPMDVSLASRSDILLRLDGPIAEHKTTRTQSS